MGARRYGPPQGRPPIPMSEYHQSLHELEGLPQTVTEKIPVTNTPDRKSTRLNSSHIQKSRMPSSA